MKSSRFVLSRPFSMKSIFLLSYWATGPSEKKAKKCRDSGTFGSHGNCFWVGGSEIQVNFALLLLLQSNAHLLHFGQRAGVCTAG
jgi:hypothetical protein